MDGIVAAAPDRPLGGPAAPTETAEQWPQTVAQFETLVEAVQDDLVHFAFCRLRSQPDAEDVVQDVLVQAYVDRLRFCAVTRVRPYLYRMVANRCTDLLRKRQRAGRNLPQAPEPDPHVRRLEEIEALLGSLPGRQAEVIRLRVFGGLSFRAVAEAAGASLPTIKSRFRYGVARLRRILSQEAER